MLSENKKFQGETDCWISMGFDHFDKKMQTYEVGRGRAVHNFYLFFKAGNTYCKEMLYTVYLLIKIACLVKVQNIVLLLRAGDYLPTCYHLP